VGAIDDVPVLSPAGFSIASRFGASDLDYRSTLDGSSLERVVLGETNPLSVWRKKRGFCALGPLQGDGLQAIQRPDEQLPLGNVGEEAAVRSSRVSLAL